MEVLQSDVGEMGIQTGSKSPSSIYEQFHNTVLFSLYLMYAHAESLGRTCLQQTLNYMAQC